MEIIIKPEDVIKAEFLELYHKERNVIYQQLIQIKNQLFIAEKIIIFPFKLLFPHPEGAFWLLTTRALIDSIILKIWILTDDKDSEFRLRRFKNKIKNTKNSWRRSDIDDTVSDELEKRLKDVHFEGRISAIATKISEIRNHYVAHLDYNSQMGIGESTIDNSVKMKELNSILAALHDLFAVLNFDSYPMLEFINYVPQPHIRDHTTDIDDLLTFVASRSMYLTDNHPPHPIHAEIQQERINKLSEEDQAIVQEWRGRVNKLFPQRVSKESD